MCFVCGVYTAATSAAAPEGGSWDVREAARVDARPPDVAALLFASIVFGLRAEDPAALLGRAFVSQTKLLAKHFHMVKHSIARHACFFGNLLKVIRRLGQNCFIYRTGPFPEVFYRSFWGSFYRSFLGGFYRSFLGSLR